MITKEFTFDSNEKEFLQWLQENNDIECLVCKGNIKSSQSKIVSDKILNQNFKMIDMTDCEIDAELSFSLDEDETYLDYLLNDVYEDFEEIPLVVKLVYAKSYTKTFLLENNKVYSSDKKMLIHVSDEKNIVIENGIEVIGTAAFRSYKFKKITFPNTLIRICDNAFEDCDEIESIELPNSVKELGKWSFSACFNLKHFKFSDSIEEIPACCFRYDMLDELEFPKALKIIRIGNTFSAGNSTHIVIPEGVEIIEADSFCGDLIDSIYIPSTVYKMENDWYYEYPIYEEGVIEQPKIELSPKNPYFHLEKGKLVHNYVANEKSQKEYSKKVLEYIDSKTLRDYLKSKDLMFTPQEMIVIAINSIDKRNRRIDWFLYDLEDATFLTKIDRLYLEYEIKRIENNWRQLNTSWKDRYIIAYGRNSFNEDWKRIKKYPRTYFVGDEANTLQEKYKYIEVKQYYTKTNEITGRYTLGKFGVAEDCLAYIDRKIPSALKKAIREERHLAKNKSVAWAWAMLSERYIQLPLPFKRGNVVKYLNDEELYVVIDVYQPSIDKIDTCDSFDMSVAVAPIEYKDLIRSLDGAEVPQEVWDKHDHLSIFRLEIVEE